MPNTQKKGTQVTRYRGKKASRSPGKAHSFFAYAADGVVGLYTEINGTRSDEEFTFTHDEWQELVNRIKQVGTATPLLESRQMSAHVELPFDITGIDGAITDDSEVQLEMGGRVLADTLSSLRIFIEAICEGEFDLEVVQRATTLIPA